MKRSERTIKNFNVNESTKTPFRIKWNFPSLAVTAEDETR